MSNNELSHLRGLQADLNVYCGCSAVNVEPVRIDGVIGPRTVQAVRAIVDAVLATNKLLVPATFTYNNPAEVEKYAPQIRDWLQAVAAKQLNVTALRLYKRGTGLDWNIKGEIAYGAGAVHDDFVNLQKSLNRFADVVGFGKLETDGFIGPKTAAAVKSTFDKVAAKNALLAVTLFPPPDTKEEAAEYAAFIRDWLDKTAAKHLLAEAGV